MLYNVLYGQYSTTGPFDFAHFKHVSMDYLLCILLLTYHKDLGTRSMFVGLVCCSMQYCAVCIINIALRMCYIKNLNNVDVPGSEYRVATISGNPDACSRAQNMVMDIVAEVSIRGRAYTFSC